MIFLKKEYFLLPALKIKPEEQFLIFLLKISKIHPAKFPSPVRD